MLAEGAGLDMRIAFLPITAVFNFNINSMTAVVSLAEYFDGLDGGRQMAMYQRTGLTGSTSQKNRLAAHYRAPA